MATDAAQKQADIQFAKEEMEQFLINCSGGHHPLHMLEDGVPSFARLMLRSGEYALAGYIMENELLGRNSGFVYTNQRIIYCTEVMQNTDYIDYGDVRKVTKSSGAIISENSKLRVNDSTMPMVTTYGGRIIDAYIKFTENFIYRFTNK